MLWWMIIRKSELGPNGTDPCPALKATTDYSVFYLQYIRHPPWIIWSNQDPTSDFLRKWSSKSWRNPWYFGALNLVFYVLKCYLCHLSYCGFCRQFWRLSLIGFVAVTIWLGEDQRVSKVFHPSGVESFGSATPPWRALFDRASEPSKCFNQLHF